MSVVTIIPGEPLGAWRDNEGDILFLLDQGTDGIILNVPPVVIEPNDDSFILQQGYDGVIGFPFPPTVLNPFSTYSLNQGFDGVLGFPFEPQVLEADPV